MFVEMMGKDAMMRLEALKLATALRRRDDVDLGGAIASDAAKFYAFLSAAADAPAE